MTYKLTLNPDYTPYEGEIISSFLVNSDGLILEYARIQTEFGINTTLVGSKSLGHTSTEELRDFTVTPEGTLHIYSGTFDPTLQSYNWQSSSSQNNTQTYLGWSTVNNLSYGGIDYYQNYVFVTDMKTYGSDEDEAKGIIRFSQTEESPIRFAESGNFIDLTVGLDNLIYGLESYGKISVYDPETLELVRSFTLEDKYNNYRGIAVNQQGEIFSAAWDGNIYYFNSTGNIVDVNSANISGVVDFNTNNFNDINISPDGKELIASDRNGLIALLSIKNQSLELQDVFPTGGNSAFVSFGTNNIIESNNPVPEISISDAEVIEWKEYEPARLNFTISLSEATNEIVEVDVHSFIPWGQEYNSQPQSFADYNDVAMMGEILTFAPGETEKTFSLEVFDDWEEEADEQIYVEIGQIFSGNATIADGLGIGTIIDDDFMPVVSIDDAQMIEGDYEDYYNAPPVMEFSVSLNAPAYRPVSVDLSMVDYPLTTVTNPAIAYEDFYPMYDWMNLIFEPGETNKTIEIEINPDDEYEVEEQFAIEITSAYGATIGDGLAVGTIIDDDFKPVVSISDAEVFEGDRFESTWMDFTVSLSGSFDEKVEVDLVSFIPWEAEYENTPLADYNDVVMTAQMLSFEPGEVEKTFSVEVLGDLELEADEQIYVDVAHVFSDNATIGDGSAVGTILDNEARKPQISISDAVAIEGGLLEFSVELDRAAEDFVDVQAGINPYNSDNYTTSLATEGEDYWGNWQSLTFAPGETSKTFTVETNYDFDVEGDEQFAVEIFAELENAVIKDNIAIGTIADNDLVIGEIGHVKNINHLEQQIQFQHQYQNPVVIVSPLTRNGKDTAIARITDIQADGFSVFVQEPTLIKQQTHAGHHIVEEFSYLVMEAGSWTMPNGAVIEVGSTQVDAYTRSANWERLELNEDFDAPVIISSVQTYNNEEFLGLRQRNGNDSSIDIALEKEEALLKTNYLSETVGYVAVESGQDYLMGMDREIGYLAGETGRTVNHRWQELDVDRHPYLFATTNSYYGGDSVGLRQQMGSIMLDEDTSRDLETGHTRENIAYLSFDNLGMITTEVGGAEFI